LPADCKFSKDNPLLHGTHYGQSEHFFFPGTDIPKLFTVHQLQNLYFALNREDLKYVIDINPFTLKAIRNDQGREGHFSM
jgi:hypothetical protein